MLMLVQNKCIWDGSSPDRGPLILFERQNDRAALRRLFSFALLNQTS